MWLISAPSDYGVPASQRMKQVLEEHNGLCSVYKLDLPSHFRIGTLDSLIAVADAAARDDRIVEATADRVLRQYRELAKDYSKTPQIDGEDVEQFLQYFEWDDAKFSPELGLSDIRQAIVDQVTRIEDDMKVQLSEYTSTKQALTAIERRSQGNFMTRSLATLVKEEHVKEFKHSEYFTTLFVVVKAFNVKDFRSEYQVLGAMAVDEGSERKFYPVVPHSIITVAEDNEYTIFAVAVARKGVEDFKADCRASDKSYTVREYEFDPDVQDRAEEDVNRLKEESNAQLVTFTKWAEANYSEAFLAMVHLKAIRAFAESVLRYGLPINFDIALLVPTTKADQKLRNALGDLYSHLGGSWAGAKDDETTNVPGVAPGDFYPYVYLELPLP